jgi:hypothetical protein
VRLLEQENSTFGQFGEFTARGAAAWLVGETGGSALVEAFLPGIERMLGEPNQGGEVAGRQSGATPGIEDEESLRRGEGDALGVRGGKEAFAAAGWTGQPWGRAEILGRVVVGVVAVR